MLLSALVFRRFESGIRCKSYWEVLRPRMAAFGLFVEKLEFAVLPKLRRGRVRCENAAQIAMLEARQDVRMRYKDFLVVLHIGAGFAPYEG